MKTRSGTVLVDELPGDVNDGPWKLTVLPNGDVVSANPKHEPRVYRDGKLVRVGLQVVV